MKTFVEFCKNTKKKLPVWSIEEAGGTRRAGIAYWAYPDGYIRSHYPASYFMPTAADALFKMGPKKDDHNVDHGEMKWQHHATMVKHEKNKSN